MTITVLVGLNAFGAVGLFLGPIILAVLLAVWQAWLEQQKEQESLSNHNDVAEKCGSSEIGRVPAKNVEQKPK